jgi:NADPH:quinone reductase-like Zn-dependent oxidoreductase
MSPLEISRRAVMGTALAATATPANSGTSTMKAYEIGDATTGLRLVERPALKPGFGQAVLKVRATGLNARDLAVLKGGLMGRGVPPTRVPLMDVAADVLSVGEGVSRVKPGDRVTMTHYWKWIDGAWDVSMREEDYSNTLDGFLAEQALVQAEPLVKIPDSVTYEDASTIPSAGLTAWNAVVEAGRAKPGCTVVTIGTGGVSVFGLLWSKLMGARVVITSSSDAKLAKMREHGADVTINYRSTPNWSQAVLDATGGRGADIVLNNVGMGEMEQCLSACASGGKVMYIGANAVTPDRKTAAPTALTRFPNLIIKDLTIKGIIVGSRRMFEDLLAAMAANKLKPIIDRVYAFDEVREAIARMESGEKIGKVVIRVQ